MNIVFIGSGEFAVDSLVRLHAESFSIPLVITQPDRPAGRGRTLRPTAVKEKALELEIPVISPETIRDPDTCARVGEISPQAIVVAAYGQKIPRSLLDPATLAAVNVHGSLLPRHRGASPVAGAILAGDSMTGVTIQLVADEIDAGDIVLQESLPIAEDDDAETLERKLGALGAVVLPHALRGLEEGTIVPVPQDHDLATLTRKIRKQQGLVPWERESSEIARHVRAFTPWPGAHSFLVSRGTGTAGEGPGSRLTVVEARAESDDRTAGDATDSTEDDAGPGTVIEADDDGILVHCGSGLLRITRIQRPGRSPLDAGAFLRGFSIAKGDRFVSGAPSGPGAAPHGSPRRGNAG